MVIFKTVADLQAYLLQIRAEKGRQLAFVPTMGALHKGHTSLVQQAKEDGYAVTASIFVNPTQFNDKEDFAKYPISVEEDIRLLIQAGCDVLFLPPVAEVYPQGAERTTIYSFGYLDTVLEGAHRPGHFKGVGQVVARLLDIVKPDRLYMGQKDYQQCMIIGSLLHQLSGSTQLVITPTVREEDGLAMSSRNRRLTDPQRAIAGLLYQCLVSIQAKQGQASFDIVKKECTDLLQAKGIEPEYIALADAQSFEMLDGYTPAKKMLALIAARIGDVRLIDNLILN